MVNIYTKEIFEMVKLDSFCLSMNRDMTITFPLEINNMDITDYELCEARIIIKLEKTKLNLLYKGSIDKNDKMVFRIPALPFNTVLDNTATMCVELIVGEQIFKLMNGVLDIDKTEVKAGQIDIKYDNDSASETDKQYQDKLSGDATDLMGLEDDEEIYGDPGSEPMTPSVEMGEPETEIDSSKVGFMDVSYSNEIEASDDDESTLDTLQSEIDNEVEDAEKELSGDLEMGGDDNIEEEPETLEDEAETPEKETKEEETNEKWFFSLDDIIREEERKKYANKLKFSLPYAGSFLSSYVTGGAGDTTDNDDFYSSDVTNVDGGIGDAGYGGGDGGGGGGGVGETDTSHFDEDEELNSMSDMTDTLAKVLKGEADLTIAKDACGPRFSDGEENKYGVKNKDDFYLNDCDECDDDEEETGARNFYNDNPQLPTVSMPPPENKYYYTLGEIEKNKKLA